MVLKRSLRTTPFTTVLVGSWAVVYLAQGLAMLAPHWVMETLGIVLLPLSLIAYLSLMVLLGFTHVLGFEDPWAQRAAIVTVVVAIDAAIAFVRWSTERWYERAFPRPAAWRH